MFFRLLYISTVRAGQSPDMVEEILAASQIRNRKNGLTGLLVFDGRRFMQYLEGEESAVRALYAKIQNDPRHYAVVTLRETNGEHRQFGDWDMAIRHSNNGGEFDAQMKKVVALTEGCENITSAELQGFVKLRAA
jgi:hypothetical protein